MSGPSASDLAERLAGLSPAKRELLERRLRERGERVRRAESIPQRADRARAPLSFAQQRLWFLHQLAPESPVYNVPRMLRFQGILDEDALRRALEEIVARHEVLRTTFAIVENRPTQVIAKSGPVPLLRTDLTSLPSAAREEEAARIAEEEQQSLFDLARGPMLRARLLRLGPEEHTLLLTNHHIVSDAWSAGVLFRELDILYSAFSRGRPSPLPAPPIQYSDFAAWQRERLQGDLLEKLLAYWKGQLAELPVLQLPTDHPRPPVQSLRGARYSLSLSNDLLKALKGLSQREGATLYMTLLAAFAALLLRYTGQEDIAVGSPIAGRNQAEIEELIGFFVNTLVMRTDLSGDPSFRELLQRVRQVALGAYAHQDLPFEKLVEELQPARDLGQNPLFQVFFALQDAPSVSSEMAGLRVVSEPAETHSTHFDLEVNLSEQLETLTCSFVYATDLFDSETIVRMAGHYVRLLEEVAADAGRRISELPLLTSAERERVLEWNRTERPYPREKTVSRLFEEQVERTPEAQAVVFGEERLSYRELNERANRLARYLRKRGVGPEVLVGLCVERSLEMTVALLGILKAGGAYVPLDPSYPRDRLAFMLEDAAAPVVVALESLSETLPKSGLERVRLDADWPEIARESGENLESEAGPANLAYVIYTSGSTGTPKGVAVKQSGVANLLLSMQELLGLSETDVLLAVTTISFDIAALEIYLPLTVGASVAVCPRESAWEGKALLEELRRCGATVMQATPVSWRLLLEAGWQSGGLRMVLCGGEALPRDLADRLLERSHSVWNLYGPTETTIWSTAWRVEGEGRAVSIGTPLANTQVFNLDSHGAPVPVGMSGELHIGGAGLARGYWNRPELTERAFVERTPDGVTAVRLYRTGDRVRYRSDGKIEYLGRMDQQVKLRGFRIELGEVESALRENPAVRDAVAVVREDGSQGARLVVYVVPNALEASGPAEPADSPSYSEQLGQWQTVWEKLYEQGLDRDPAFDIVGWNSSYTGQPLPAGEMKEWVDRTVERILSLGPSRVLEIGCGTGLVLLRVAPHCSSYTGTDFSPKVLEQLQAVVRRPELRLPAVQLLAKSAEDFEGIPRREFDTVVLNSVVQYFPNVEYLLLVMEGAVEAVSDGGTIFIGDVRSLPLLEAFHLSVELERAAALLPVEELARRVHRGVAQEEELVLDPGFFLALRRHLPRIEGVEVLLKAGRYDNELSRYRYDVILRIGPLAEPAIMPSWLDWGERGLTVKGLQRLFEEQRPAAIGIRNVPNIRLARDVRALELIESGESPPTVGELRTLLEQSPSDGADPTEFWSWELPYTVDLSWSSSSPSGAFDVALRWRDHDSGSAPVRFPNGAAAGKTKPWRSYASDPSHGAVARKLVPQLRAYLREKLPDYMVPSAFVVLDELPLTPNGKVDRRALPPDQPGAAREGAFQAPRDPIQEVLVGIWGEVLGLTQVGVEDDFFALGGHSLLATQVISRIRDAFDVELPLRSLFEAPRVAGLARKISSVRRQEPASPAPQLLPAPHDREFLSFAQQRLWFLDQLEPGNPFYTTSRVVRLMGDLDVDALQEAFAGVVARHESLRTRFESVDGRPVQIIEENVSFRVLVADLEGLLPKDREETIARRVAKELSRPFDLAVAPLLRATLWRLSKDEHVLLVSTHHIVSDAWSMGILVKELAALYEESRRGVAGGLPRLPVQYADFARWQREWLSGEVLDKQLSYWRKQLAGMAPKLELPTDRPRPPAQSFRGDRRSVSLPKNLVTALTELSRREGTTLYMTLLAAFQTLLMRYTGQEDVVVGSPIAGRNRGEIEGLIGFFINTLVLRTDLSGDPSFRELLRRVREVALGAYDHQDLPFEKLVEDLDPERDLGANPLFQILFALQNAPETPFELAGLRVMPLAVESRTTRFDLEVHLREKPDGLTCTFVYATDLFDSGTIVRMMGHFQNLLEEIVRDADRPVSRLGILSERERRQVLEEWNRTAAEYPREATLPELFERQVETAPQAEALVCGRERLTYAQLEERSNRLARYLSKLGVGPEVLVGLCVERSVEMVVGLLGILKAGGAYLPLDPSYPSKRLAFMLEDTAARVVVTQESLLGSLPAGDFRRVSLDADWGEIARERAEKLERRANSRNLAYVIYTSGSTGKPKGVAIEHRSTVALLAWAREVFSDAELGGVLASTSICFDLSVFELFAPLAWGGKVILAQNALELAQLSAAGEVKLVNTVPSAMGELLRMGELPESVETVNLAGEPLAALLVREISRRGRVKRVLDLYGPTEDTTYSTCARRSGEGPATIGRPISNKRVYILDAHLGPVPVGVAGDLYVAGAGLARGYLNHPELTALRFQADPFRAGQRMYQTGDRARFLADGNIQFLGRLDHQVKIRGYRVEMGEIEEALARHPGIRACAVAARHDQRGSKRLVAYIVPSDGEAPTLAQLREFLKESLPDYMVPSVFVFLQALPVTPNGKVDRQALPPPEQTRPELENLFVPPRNAVEETVAGIWCQVLGLERVGIHDNFFELGGHSLLATRVFARLQKAFPLAPPLRILFEKPTVAELSTAIEDLRQAGSGSSHSHVLPVSRQAQSPKPPDPAEEPSWTATTKGLLEKG